MKLVEKWTDRRLLEEGGRYPKGWGVCYRDSATCNAVIARIPFNWLIGWYTEFKWRAARGPWPVFGCWRSERQKDLRLAREAGRQRGYEEGFADAQRQAAETISETFFKPFGRVL
jgi:hypothetical protein